MKTRLFFTLLFALSTIFLTPVLAEDEVLPSETITEVQRRLAQLGLYRGPADGIVGPKTKQAVRQYQEIVGLPVDGHITFELIRNLRNVVRQRDEPPLTTPPKAEQNKIDQPTLQPACKPKNELQHDIKQIFRLLTEKQIPEKEEDDISSIIADEFHKACLSLEPQLIDLALRIFAKLKRLEKKPCVVDFKKIEHFDITLEICREGRDPLSITVGPQDLVVAWAILKRKALCSMFAKKWGLEGSDVEEFCGKRPPEPPPPQPNVQPQRPENTRPTQTWPNYVRPGFTWDFFAWLVGAISLAGGAWLYVRWISVPETVTGQAKTPLRL